jgi:hypothetical protein
LSFGWSKTNDSIQRYDKNKFYSTQLEVEFQRVQEVKYLARELSDIYTNVGELKPTNGFKGKQRNVSILVILSIYSTITKMLWAKLEGHHRKGQDNV